MDAQENKQLALQKAISAHEQAEAALTDLMNDLSEPIFQEMLDRVELNILELKGRAATTEPEDLV